MFEDVSANRPGPDFQFPCPAPRSGLSRISTTTAGSIAAVTTLEGPVLVEICSGTVTRRGAGALARRQTSHGTRSNTRRPGSRWWTVTLSRRPGRFMEPRTTSVGYGSVQASPLVSLSAIGAQAGRASRIQIPLDPSGIVSQGNVTKGPLRTRIRCDRGRPGRALPNDGRPPHSRHICWCAPAVPWTRRRQKQSAAPARQFARLRGHIPSEPTSLFAAPGSFTECMNSAGRGIAPRSETGGPPLTLRRMRKLAMAIDRYDVLPEQAETAPSRL
jgi:hypothetical protein